MDTTPDPMPSVSQQGFLRRITNQFGLEVRDQPWSNPLILAFAVGLIAALSYAWSREHHIEGVAIVLLVSGAAVAVGALTGFLFGIPRSVQQSPPAEPSASWGGSDFRVNTNLEQISDWLTKIIVGIGLTQLGTLPHKFTLLAIYVASAFGYPEAPPSLVASALVYFGILGFLASYLWTRLLLTGEFSRADRLARQSPEFLEGLVEALLYQPAPGGFTSAIQHSLTYTKLFGEANWRIWRSLACAYGQQYSYLKATGKASQEELSSARNSALDAVKRAIQLSPDECSGLRALWDPAQVTPQEDDLLVFQEDKGFAEVFAPCSEDND